MSDAKLPAWVSAAAPATAVLLAFLIAAIPLAAAWHTYFPYEDDFAFLYFSAHENHPNTAAWVTEGFSNYFANDPNCVLRDHGFVRPVMNVTYYLESFLGGHEDGVRLMLTNIVCWLAAVLLLFAIARRFGASPWEAAVAAFLFALSPCWYRNLVHSVFRINPLAAVWTLCAFVVVLGPLNRLTRWRMLAAGMLLALAIGTHDQGELNLPVFALLLLYRLVIEAPSWRARDVAAKMGILLGPSAATMLVFRLVSSSYGQSYAANAFLESLRLPMAPLARLGITSPLITGLLRLPVAVAQSRRVLTPVGADNLVAFPSAAETAIFLALVAAVLMVLWKAPRGASVSTDEARVSPGGKLAKWKSMLLARDPARLLLAAAVLFPYAIARNFTGMNEPRFAILEVAFGLVLAVAALSAARRLGLRGAAAAAVFCLLGVLVFNCASYKATILDHRADFVRRNQADRRAFQMIQNALESHPNARIVLINDQMGMWSAMSMLRLAGLGAEPAEILPSMCPGDVSMDFARSYDACPARTQVSGAGGRYFIRLSYPAVCRARIYGRDSSCTVAHYRNRGLMTNAAWASCSAPGPNSLNCGPITHEIRLNPAEKAILVAWHTPLEPPKISIVGS